MTHYQVVVAVAGWIFKSDLMTKHGAEQCAIDFKMRNPYSTPTIEPVETVVVRSISQPIAL